MYSVVQLGPQCLAENGNKVLALPVHFLDFDIFATTLAVLL